MPVDVYEGPAMNHSYHEMIIGHGKCFSTILISDAAEEMREIGIRPIIIARSSGNAMALAERGRAVVSITLRDLEDGTLRCAGGIFPAGGDVDVRRRKQVWHEFKPAGGKKKAPDKTARGLIPCLIVLIGGLNRVDVPLVLPVARILEHK